MLEDAAGRLLAGALWGLGAGLILTLTRGGGLRSLAKGTVKGYLTVAEGVQDKSAEMRENIGDLAAEVRAERPTAIEAQASEGSAER